MGAAQTAGVAGQAAEEQVLRLLGNACSMMLRPKSLNEPFGPMFTMTDGSRSALPKDFSVADLEFFHETFERLPDRRLQARMADLLWLVQRPRSAKCALVAIDAYRQSPLTFDALLSGGRDCQERATRLSLMLGECAEDRRDLLEREMMQAIEAAGAADEMLALWLAKILFDTGLGRTDQESVAQMLHSLAVEFEAANEVLRARAYFEEAERWYVRAGDEAKTISVRVVMAEGWVREGQGRISGDKPSYSVAAMFYENAVQQYRRIPRKRRSAEVQERIEELRAMVRAAGERSLEEMHEFSPPGIDISGMVKKAKAAVAGKTTVDALYAFSGIFGIPRFAGLRKKAIDSLRENPLHSMIPLIVRSSTGRVIAKHDGRDQDNEEDSEALWHELITNYCIQIDLGVAARIWPALEVVRCEHRLTQEDMEFVVARSPVIPLERTRLFARALYAGFDNDFVAAVHILAPQIEHLVRWHLNRVGIVTTTIDENGIENEAGLSALLDRNRDAVNRVFGENLGFELAALFANGHGPNLRNQIAHGLFDDGAIPSSFMVYAWWWAFKLAFRTSLEPTRTTSAENSEDSGSHGCP